MFNLKSDLARTGIRVNEFIPYSCSFNAKSDFVSFQLLMPITAAAAGLLGTIGASAINAASQARVNAQNREQANRAYREQAMAIQRQNEYNSPGQQTLRMVSAGLNPSLVYGAGGELVGQQSDIPSYTPIPSEAPQVSDFGAAARDVARVGIELKDLKRKQELAAAEIASKSWQNYLASTQGALNEAETKETLTLLGYRVENLESQTQLNWESVLRTRQEISNLQEQKKEIQSRVRLNDAQVLELSSLARLNDTQVYAILQKLPHELALMDAEAAFSWMQTEVGRATVEKIASEIGNIQFVQDLESRKFKFDKSAWGIEQKKWAAELDQERKKWLFDAISRVISVGVGAAAYRSGPVSSVPRSSPASSHHGSGYRYPAQAPETNSQGVPLGRGYRK